MKIKQFDIWIADLNPRMGTEPGKMRPVVVIQSDLLNQVGHPSTIVCPITTKVIPNADILRVHLSSENSQLSQNSDILIDQIRAIDNRRLTKKIGKLSAKESSFVLENIRVVLDI